MSLDLQDNGPGYAAPWLVDAKVACRLIGIGTRSLWSLTKNGAIPSRRIGRSVRYSPLELKTWMERGCPTAPNAGEAIRKAVRR